MPKALQMSALRIASCVLFAACLAALSGCACFNAKNRPLTSGLDRVIDPKSMAAKAALVPIAVPLGFCSLTLDTVAIYPATQIPKTYDDTMDVLWRNPQGDYVRQTFLFLPKVVLTPLVFTGAFIGEGYWDL